MPRTQRLFELIQILRRHRHPVTGAALALELNISLRTLYRDIATLQQQGADIEGEAGIGYVLKPGFMLPPLMFSEEEMEALILGSRWVAQRADDPKLAAAADNALAKITAVLPKNLHDLPDTCALLVGPSASPADHGAWLPLIRQAIRNEHKIAIHYQDLKGVASTRTLWPFALGFFDQARIVVAWCELRQSFRHFRVDRIRGLCVSSQRYPRRRHALLNAWRESEGIPKP